MLPDFGFSEMFVVAVIALIVVGPKDLPVMMRRAGQFMGRLRAMASEFRASFDDMARQSELDDLRKEVEALRSGKPLYSSPEDEARHAEITDIYSNIESGVAKQGAQLHPPMSYQYDEEVLGLAPTAQAAPPPPTPPSSTATPAAAEPDPATTMLPKAGAGA